MDIPCFLLNEITDGKNIKRKKGNQSFIYLDKSGKLIYTHDMSKLHKLEKISQPIMRVKSEIILDASDPSKGLQANLNMTIVSHVDEIKSKFKTDKQALEWENDAVIIEISDDEDVSPPSPKGK